VSAPRFWQHSANNPPLQRATEKKARRNRVSGRDLDDRLGVPGITKHLPAVLSGAPLVSRTYAQRVRVHLSPGETR